MAKMPECRIIPAGANAVRNSKSVQDFLLDRAQRIAESASSKNGGTYIADVQPGKYRAHAMVKTRGTKTQLLDRKTNALSKSIDAGR